MTEPLWPHQAAAIERFAGRSGMLAFEPGAGKTRTAIELARDARRVLVVCPKAAIADRVWQNRIEQFHRPAAWVTPKTPGNVPAALATWQPAGGPLWCILNYEKLLRPAKARKPTVRNWPSVMGILEWQPDVVIFDESHAAKNPTTKTYKACEKLAQAAGRVYLLTGTPVGNNLLDLYAQFKLIDPQIWRYDELDEIPPWSRWKQHVGVWGGFENRVLMAYRDPKDILRRIDPHVISVEKREIRDLLGLHPQKRKIVPFRIHPRDFDRLLTTTRLEPHVLTRQTRWQQGLGRIKAPATARRAAALLAKGEDHVVVYYRFIADADRIRHHSARMGHEVFEISGRITDRQRGEALDTWREVGGVLLVQMQTAAEAIDLSAATHAIYHTPTWSHTDHRQSQDRLDRPGVAGAVTYHYMLARAPDGTELIDDLVLTALSRKGKVAQYVQQRAKHLPGEEDFR